MKEGRKFMNKYILSVLILTFSNISHAGYLIGADSINNGVVKIEQSLETDLIIISHCMSKNVDCKEIQQQKSSTFTEIIDVAQLGGAFITQVGPVGVLALMSFGEVSFALTEHLA